MTTTPPLSPSPQTPSRLPPGYSLPATIIYFVLGGLLTAAFSRSLSPLTWPRRDANEVLAVGMVVPSLTWVIQLAASAARLPNPSWRAYWGDLARACLFGSAILFAAGGYNAITPHAPRAVSAISVAASVLFMAFDLFRRSGRHGVARSWPISWCVTIACSIALFLWVSRAWWGTPP